MKSPKPTFVQMLFIAGLLSLAAWSLQVEQSPARSLDSKQAVELPQGDWELVQISGTSLLPGSRISLLIDAGQLGGFSGCNQYGGPFEVLPDGRVQINEIAATAMACIAPEGIMEQEARYFSLLNAAAAFSDAGDRLAFLGTDGVEILVFNRIPEASADPAALAAHAWQLVDLDGSEIERSEPPVQVRFEDGVLTGFSGCRYFVGAYVLQDADIAITALEMLPGECAPEGRTLEDAFLETTDRFERYSIAGDRLEIQLQTGTVLGFTALQPAAEDAMAGAEASLRLFFDLLQAGDYQAASVLFAGPEDFLDTLRSYNPGVPRGSVAALLKAGCLRQFRCMPVLDVVEQRVLSDHAALFRVTFQDADGQPFTLGPCCGDDSPAEEGPTVYTYLVEKAPEGYRISGGLVYVP